ncbi:MAG TPA: ABC transporter substrate-binding protein, partial [Thermoanaerobaculia bacterium]|nr:ABC transporter substrate-binding protein [Thermoanaerobaculia bacterium]
IAGPVLAAAAFLLPSCAKKEVKPDVKIGVIAELTGDIPAVGASCKNAAQMAVDEINAAGGIDLGGVKHGLSIVVEDSAAKADQAAAAAQKLINQDQVLAIVGPNASLGAIPAAQIAEGAQTLLITPWSTNPKTTLDNEGKPKKWVVRACFTDTFQGRVLSRFAHDYMHATKAGVLYDVASEAPKGQAELFKADFEKDGGKVVAFETYTTSDKDFSAQLTKIKAAAPELVFLPSYYSDVPLQLQQAHRLGLTVPFLGSDSWSSPEIIKLAGQDAEGAYFCNHYSPGAKNEITGRFVVSYKKKYGQEPDDVAALTYDAFGVLAKAIASAGKLDRQALRDALSKITTYDGVTGKISYPAGSGDPVKGAVMMKISGGKFVWVTNVDPL